MLLHHPLQQLTPRAFRRGYWIALSATLAFAVILGVIGNQFAAITGPGGVSYDVIDLEFAGTAEHLEEIFATWGAAGKRAAVIQTLLDFIFLIAYSMALAFGVIAVAGGAPAGGRVARLGIALAWGQWLAAFLDAVENAALLRVLLGTPASPWPQIAYLCAGVKFALVFAGLLYILVFLPLRRETADPEH